MSPFIELESYYRSVFSLGGLAVFWSLSLLLPFRRSKLHKDPKRIITNLALNFGNAFIVRLLVPLSLVQLTVHPSTHAFKLFHWDEAQFYFSLIFGVILLDAVIYWQHRLTHRIPLLWRLHRVHHSDTEFDTTTAGRFHIFEIFFSFMVKGIFVVLFDLSAETIITFEIILNFSALFNHSNFEFPAPIEKLLRWVLITPGLHRIHHSVRSDEMHYNFGFSVSLWDRLFKSYKETSRDNPQTMTIGLNEFREPGQQSYGSLFVQPFSKK